MPWNYSEKTKQLFLDAVQGKPGTHLGEVKDADGVGEHGSIVCGDALKFTFRVKKAENPLDDVIVEARYLTFGCTSAIAASEALCCIVEQEHLTPPQALSISNDDIVRVLDGLPAQKIHCSVMGAEALQAAVFDWAARRGVTQEQLATANPAATHVSAKQDEGRIVCKCFAITEPYLRRKIKELDLHTCDEVTSALKAGGMCGLCRNAPGGIQDILNDIWGVQPAAKPSTDAPSAPADAASAAPSPFQFAKQVEKVIAETARPLLQADGGDVEVVDIKDHLVYVTLKGHCASCPGASMTLQHLIEGSLRKAIASDIRVIPV